MQVILLVDIKSATKKKDVFYGRKDDKVLVVAIHEDVYIVDNGKEKFAVHKNKVA